MKMFFFFLGKEEGIKVIILPPMFPSRDDELSTTRLIGIVVAYTILKNKYGPFPEYDPFDRGRECKPL